MKNEKSQLILQTYKKPKDKVMKNYTPTILTTQKKWTTFQRLSPPKLNQEEIDQLNRPITRTEIEYVIKTLPTNKSLGPDGFTDKSYQHTKNLYPSFLNFSKTLKKKEHSQTHFIFSIYHICFSAEVSSLSGTPVICLLTA